MSRPPHIVFAGGAKPGHLYPGLAVAAHLIERIPNATVTFVGSTRGMDHHVIRAAGFGYACVPSHPEPQNALHAVRFVTHNVAGYWASRWFLKENHVSAVVGLGGASSAATVRAAISRGIPTVLLEQNVVPGRVNRWLSRSANAVCAGFAATRSYFPSAVPISVTGNPARPAFERLYRQPVGVRKRSDVKRLIILGGAGGARSLNEHMPYALARLRAHLTDWQILHQSGEGQLQKTDARYRAAGVEALVVAYIDEIAPIMFGSDLVVCRSGGTTLAELALAGTPAILVPYPPIMQFHLANAEVFAEADAARVIDESDLIGPLAEALADQLEPLLSDGTRRQRMAANMRRMARPAAAANVTELVYEAMFPMSARLAA
ncbi:MAG TPA: UDP-N-acetylglucosamine--N-acetylmuramyl-(pentapeptide) pyrophosphoryl-undecaprenol N-acetylglucosamine transferase [Lacipirellulaceae bacterium]|nr:UDP-N-acetylglucosamine--N-acetylmuramyl-(pentapeptide) pyrophosphoryl-undecaprenol N-acetylglucosamine transferase [Lacipirellulaceae bacterium]